MILYRVIIICINVKPTRMSVWESFSWESRKDWIIVLTLVCMVRTTCKKSLSAQGGGGGGGGWCTMRKWPSAGHTWDIYINKTERETAGTGGDTEQVISSLSWRQIYFSWRDWSRVEGVGVSHRSRCRKAACADLGPCNSGFLLASNITNIIRRKFVIKQKSSTE